MTTFFVTSSYPDHDDDPAGHFVQADARRLREAGESVTVLCPGTAPNVARGPGTKSEPSKDGIRVLRLGGGAAFGWPGAAARIRERPIRVASALGFLTRAALHLRANADDSRNTIVGHWSLPSIVPVALAAPRARAMAVSHGGDVRLLLALPAGARERLVKTIAGRVSEWRFVSAELLASLVDVSSANVARAVERVAVVALSAVEWPAFVPQRPSCDFVTVGRLVPSKRVDHVLRHVAARGSGPKLVVVGDGPERGALERLASDLRVDAHFVGKVPRREALAWMRAASVLLHASRSEGASTVLREASMLGVAVEIVP